MDFWDSFSDGQDLYLRLTGPVCARHGLTRTEFHVLMFLANNPRFSTAADIVEKRHLSKSHVSVSVRALQERGFLAGEYREGNRRTVHLKLCPAAGQAVADGQAAQAEFGAALLRGFTREEQQAMQEFFRRIRQNAAEYRPAETEGKGKKDGASG